MPLLKREPPAIDDVPDTLKDASMDTMVFQVPFTGEIYDDYGEFDSKMIYYLQPMWTCQKSSKVNMTFQEALNSEKRVASEIQEWFPECWIKPALEIIHYNCGSLNKVSDELFDFFNKNVYVGEFVWVEPPLVSQSSLYCKIVAEIPQNQITDGSFVNGRLTAETVAQTPETPQRQGSRYSNRTPSKKDKSDAADIGAASTATEPVYKMRLYKSLSTIPISVEENRGKPVEMIVERHKFHRDRRALSKTLFRKFIRDHVTRDTMKDAPYLVHEPILLKYSIEKKPGPMAQAYLDRKAAIVNKERMKLMAQMQLQKQMELQQQRKQLAASGMPLIGLNSAAAQVLNVSWDPALLGTMVKIATPLNKPADSILESGKHEQTPHVVTALPRPVAMQLASGQTQVFIPPGLPAGHALLSNMSHLFGNKLANGSSDSLNSVTANGFALPSFSARSSGSEIHVLPSNGATIDMFNGLSNILNASGAAAAAAAAGMRLGGPFMPHFAAKPAIVKAPLFPMEDLELIEYDFKLSSGKPESLTDGAETESVEKRKAAFYAKRDFDAALFKTGFPFISEDLLPTALSVFSFILTNRKLLRLEHLEMTFEEFCDCLHDTKSSLDSLDASKYHDDDAYYEESLITQIFSGVMAPIAGDFFWNMRNGGKPSTGGLIDSLRYCHSPLQLKQLAANLDLQISSVSDDNCPSPAELGYGLKVAKAFEKFKTTESAELQCRMLREASIFAGTLSDLTTKDRAMVAAWCKFTAGKIIPPLPPATTTATVVNRSRVSSASRRSSSLRQQIQVQHKQLCASEERQAESHIGWELTLVGCIKDTMMDSEYKFELLNRLFPPFEDEPLVVEEVASEKQPTGAADSDYDDSPPSKKRKSLRDSSLRSGKRRSVDSPPSVESEERDSVNELVERAREKSDYFWLAKRCSRAFFKRTSYVERLNLLKFLIDDVLVTGGSYHEQLDHLLEPYILLLREKRELLRSRQHLVYSLKSNDFNEVSRVAEAKTLDSTAPNGAATVTDANAADKKEVSNVEDELDELDDDDDIESLTPIASDEDLDENDLDMELEDLVGESLNNENLMSNTNLTERLQRLEEEKLKSKQKEQELLEYREQQKTLKRKKRTIKEQIETSDVRLREIDYEIRLALGQRRLPCLGMDRFFNKYYWLDSFVKDTFANDCALLPEEQDSDSTQPSDEMPKNGYAPFGRLIIEDVGLDATMDESVLDRIYWGSYKSKWKYIDNVEDFNAFVNSLDSRGVRERELERSFKNLQVSINKTITLLE